MNRFVLIAGVALTQLFTAAPSAAESPAVALTMTLADAVALAWARTPAASALLHRQAAADAHARAADGWAPGPPSVGLSTLNDRLQARAGRQEWEIEVATPLWQPGQRDAQRALAQTNQRLLSARALARRLELAGQVRQAWWQLATARASLALAQRRVASADALHADVERRLRAGELARTDANASGAEVQMARTEWLEAEREERTAMQSWRALVGVEAPAVVAEEPVPPDLSATDTHPALVAARATVDAAQAQLRAADRNRREAPELALRWIRERGNGAEPYASALGVQLRIPLSSAPKASAELSGVRAELAEAESEHLALREQLRLDAESAHRELESADKMLDLARTRAALSADTSSLLQKSFALGETDLATLLRARAEAFHADAALARQALARSAAVSRLHQSLGILP